LLSCKGFIVVRRNRKVEATNCDPVRVSLLSAETERLRQDSERVLKARKNRSRYKGRTGDALAPGGEEGRGKQRNATGSCKRTWIRRYPNGGTRQRQTAVTLA
jgi:hypothetical protein